MASTGRPAGSSARPSSSPSTADLQSGFKLKLSLLGEEDTKLKLHANLIAPGRDKPLVDTAYKIDDNGLLLVGGVRHLDGKVFFAIHCRGMPLASRL